MKYKILIADHDSLTRNILTNYLSDFYEIIEADTSEVVLNEFHSQQIDLIILDIAMPQADRFQIIREIRLLSSVPVVVLTHKSSIDDQVKGYDLGADDYVIKPCEGRLLVAKTRRLLARAYNEKEVNQELAFGQLVINKLARTVCIEQEWVSFRPKEFDLLVFLIENKGVALDRDQILDEVWGIDYFGDTRVVDTHIKKIRKKLGSYSDYIHTIFGIGYKFEFG